MEITTKKADALFDKLKIQESNSNHHRRGFIIYKGEKLFPPIYFSKGRKKIPKQIVSKLMKSLFLDAEQFQRLTSCKMSFDEYIEVRPDCLEEYSGI